MSNMTFSPLTETYLIRPNLEPARHFGSVLSSLHSQHPDLVLLCDDQRLAYNSEVLVTMFPVIRQLVQQNNASCCNLFMDTKVEMFVTLEGVRGDLMVEIMKSVYEGGPMKFAKHQMKEIRDVFRMLGVDNKLFYIEKTKETPESTNKNKVIPPRELERLPPPPLNSYTPPPSLNSYTETNNKRKFEEHTDSFAKKSKNVEAPIDVIQDNIPVSTEEARNQRLQKFPRNLTITCIKEEPKDNTTTGQDALVKVKEEPRDNHEVTEDAMAKSSEVEDNNSILRCPVTPCPPSATLQLKTRSELLLHLSISHYSEGLMDLVPFNKGETCALCIEQKRPKLMVANRKGSHLSHIGVNHQMVLTLLPPDLRELLISLPKRGKMASMGPMARTEGSQAAEELVTKDDFAKGDYNRKENELPADYNTPTDFSNVTIKQEKLSENPDKKTVSEEQTPSSSNPTQSSQFPGYQNPSSSGQDSYTRDSPYPSQQTVTLYPSPAKTPSYPSQVPSYPSQEVTTLYPNTDYHYPNQYNSYPSQDYPPTSSNILAPLSMSEFESFPVADPSEYPNPAPHYYDPSYPNFPSYPTTFPPTYPTYPQTPIEATEIKQEPEFNAGPSAVVDPEPANDLKSLKSEELPAIKTETPEESTVHTETSATEEKSSAPEEIICTLCTSRRAFGSESEHLFHLTIAHFSRNIVKLHPFKAGQVCHLCPEDSSFSASSTSSHISHLGIHHKLVLTFLPGFKEEVSSEEKTEDKPPVEKVEEKQKIEVGSPTLIGEQTIKEEFIDKKESSVSNETCGKVETVQESVIKITENTTEPTAVIKEVPVTKEEPEEPSDPVEVRCSLCVPLGRERMFNRRSDLLKHLTLLHFGKQLLKTHPFSPDTPCSLCKEAGRTFMPSRKEVWVCHVGVVHSRLFELLPREILEMVKSLPNTKRPEKLSGLVQNSVDNTVGAVIKTEIKDNVSTENITETNSEFVAPKPEVHHNSENLKTVDGGETQPPASTIQSSVKVEFNKPWSSQVDKDKVELKKAETNYSINEVAQNKTSRENMTDKINEANEHDDDSQNMPPLDNVKLEAKTDSNHPKEIEEQHTVINNPEQKILEAKVEDITTQVEESIESIDGFLKQPLLLEVEDEFNAQVNDIQTMTNSNSESKISKPDLEIPEILTHNFENEDFKTPGQSVQEVQKSEPDFKKPDLDLSNGFFRKPEPMDVEDEFLKQEVVTLEENESPVNDTKTKSFGEPKKFLEVEDNDTIEVVFTKPASVGTKGRKYEKPEREPKKTLKTEVKTPPKREPKTPRKDQFRTPRKSLDATQGTIEFKKPDSDASRRVTRSSLREEGRRTSPRLSEAHKEGEENQVEGLVKRTFNCRYCPGLFAGSRELKEHLVNHREQFSQINQTPRKNQLVNLRMGTPRK